MGKIKGWKKVDSGRWKHENRNISALVFRTDYVHLPYSNRVVLNQGMGVVLYERRAKDFRTAKKDLMNWLRRHPNG